MVGSLANVTINRCLYAITGWACKLIVIYFIWTTACKQYKNYNFSYHFDGQVKIIKQNNNNVIAGNILNKLSFTFMCIPIAPIINIVVNAIHGNVIGFQTIPIIKKNAKIGFTIFIMSYI